MSVIYKKEPLSQLQTPSSSILVGVGLRHLHFPYYENNGPIEVDFFEAISENFIHTRGRPFYILEKMRQNFPIALHGVSLSIAAEDDLDFEYLEKLKELYQAIDPFLISDHLCWTGKNAHNLHNLLPFSYDQKNLEYVCEKIEKVQDYLQRQLIFENLSAYFTLNTSEMNEAEFMNKICDRTGCGVLLDINNVYVNSVNQKFDPCDYLKTINMKHVKQVHLAGFSDYGDYLFDTHSTYVHSNVWDLFKKFYPDTGNVPVLVEWDENIPEFSIVQEEALKAKKFFYE